MRMVFALVDTDGDGTISLQELQAAHERIFNCGQQQGRQVDPEEMQAFMHGSQ
ncbi:hypothetical protein ACRAVF_19610 [Bradyrhizobium oligotrophicum S58]